jgi:hypothetical protein
MEVKIAPAALAGIYFSPGKIFSAVDGLEFGATYRMESRLKIDPFNATAGILGGVINMNLMLAIFDYYSPHAIMCGAAYTRWGVTLSCDVDYEMWSKVEVGKTIKYHYFGRPAYANTLSYRAGFKYDTPLTWLAVMAGYSYVPSVLEKNAGTRLGLRIGSDKNIIAPGMYNYLDNDKHSASIGLKFTVPKQSRLGGQFIFTVSYQFQYLVPKSVKKTGYEYDSSLPPPSIADVVQTYLLNPSYTYGGMNHTIVAEVGMRI